MSEYKYDPCPFCKKRKVLEFYNGWSVDEPMTETYTYYCENCGILGVTEHNHLENQTKFIKIHKKYGDNPIGLSPF